MNGTDQLDDLRLATRSLVETELDPLSSSLEAGDLAAAEPAVARMKELGYFGLTIPEKYGGVGLSLDAYLVVVQELGRTHSYFFHLVDDNNGMGSMLLQRAGNDEQKARYLHLIASGQMLTSFALTEPGAGSDAASIRTSAKRVGDHYQIDGVKHYITNGSRAGLITVLARFLQPSGGSDGHIALLVEPGFDGFSVTHDEPMMGLRGTTHNELLFEGCHVPLDNRVGEETTGMRSAGLALEHGRLVVAAWSLGVARKALDLAIAHAGSRQQFGKAIGEFQGVQWLLADSATELEAAAMFLESVARRVTDGIASRRQSSMVKLFATESANRIVDRSLQVFGGAGYTTGLPLERMYRDIRAMRIIEGTSEVQRHIIGRSLLAGGST